MLEKILNSLGFDEDEVKTYLLLLEHGPSTVGNLTKATGGVRTSLYGYLKRLQRGGLINQSYKGSVKIFSAEPPEKINLLFEERIGNLQKSQDSYKDILPGLQKLLPSSLLAPKLQIFEGREGLQHMVKDIFLYKDLVTQSFWPIKKMIEILTPEFFFYMNKQRIRNNLTVQALWPAAQKVDTKKYPFLGSGEQFKREFRIAPPGIDCVMGYWIYGRKVSFVSSQKESFGFIIESTEFAEMLLTQFKFLWNASKALKVESNESQKFLEEMKRAGI